MPTEQWPAVERQLLEWSDSTHRTRRRRRLYDEATPDVRSPNVVTEMVGSAAAADERYLLLVDVSGYTAFMRSVEQAHGVDFSGGIPAGFSVLGALLDTVISGVEPAFEVAKLEGDAVFAAAPAASLDGQGSSVLHRLRTVYRAFRDRREERARSAKDHLCTACPVVATLDLKMVLHRGQTVRQTVGSQAELLGPAVNIAHRLLKNTVHARFGYRSYVFITDAAAGALDLAGYGVAHAEEYADVGGIHGRVLTLTAEAEMRQPTQGQA